VGGRDLPDSLERILALALQLCVQRRDLRYMLRTGLLQLLELPLQI